MKPSQSLLELYEMIKKETHDDELDIMEVQQELANDETQGLFFVNMVHLEKYMLCRQERLED